MPRPFLAYIHLLPPHHPYAARRDFADKFLDGWARSPKPVHPLSPGVDRGHLNLKRWEYDEYLAFVDHEFGRLLSNLSRHGLLDDTILMLTSDHGEMLERGILGHANPTLFEPIVRIPLMISSPGNLQPKEIYSPTSAIDLMPTILSMMNVRTPSWAEGTRLPGLGGEPRRNRSTFSVEVKRNPKWEPLQKATLAMIKGRYKLIHYLSYEGYEQAFELFDLENDPEERRDICEGSWPEARSMRRELLQRLNRENRKV